VRQSSAITPGSLAAIPDLGQAPGMRSALVLCAVVFLSGCGASTSEPSIRVADSIPRLTSLLRSNGVKIRTDTQTKPAPLASAWKAFSQFAALSVSRKDLENDSMADALLFEAGTYDFGGRWGRTFQLSFARQYGMKDGDLQQVHLIAYFEPQVFDEIRSQIGVISCAANFQRHHPPGCAALCSYAGRHQLIGSPCRLITRGTAGFAGSSLEDVTVWSYDTGGGTDDAQRRRWVSFVGSSMILRRALTNKRLLGYEVWQESVE
jgi:hypothetical protein